MEKTTFTKEEVDTIILDLVHKMKRYLVEEQGFDYDSSSMDYFENYIGVEHELYDPFETEEILKEMVYTESSVTTLLAKGIYNNHEFCVLSYGTHPCAYVKLNEDDKDYNISSYDLIDDITCHGGVTFLSTFGENDCEFRSKGKWIGWDYAHLGDRFGEYSYDKSCSTISYDKSYTTKEIVEEAKHVIDMLIKN